jgi:hypothetical protein
VNVYHGTSLPVATAIATTPTDVTVSKGGGELGRGFYAGDSVALAAAWAHGRYPDEPAVLEIDVPSGEYVRLSILTLKPHQVIKKWRQLQASGKTRVFTFGYDVVYAPFASYPAWQHKFESDKSEILLRKSLWRIV